MTLAMKKEERGKKLWDAREEMESRLCGWWQRYQKNLFSQQGFP